MSKNNLRSATESLFRERFGEPAAVVSAPGRINLIGEHTDYNDGFVMPCAIGNRFILVARPNDSDRCNLVSARFGSVTLSLDDRSPGAEWFRYVSGMTALLCEQGHAVSGFDLVLDGDIPAGAGLSSSAALCCGTGWIIKEMFGLDISRLEIALIAQRTEHEFIGLKCGIMDQYASLFGERGKAMLLDCRSLTHESLPFDPAGCSLLLVDSKVEHHLASSEYNLRRESCMEGLQILRTRFEVASLRDADYTMLESVKENMDPVVYKRCRYVIGEIDRTRSAADDLRRNDIVAFGRKMFETHRGLSGDYAVSCEETDFLVGCAGGDSSVLGARMMGGGFGGCVLNIIRTPSVERFRTTVREKYVARFKKEPDFYQVTPEQGVVRLA